MLKRITIVTVEEFDSNGKLAKKTVTETLEDDGENQYYHALNPFDSYDPWTAKSTDATHEKILEILRRNVPISK